MHFPNVPKTQALLRPLTLRGWIFAACLGTLISGGVLRSADGRESDAAANKPIVFDIPAQPLAQALDSYGRATGMAALVDEALTAGRRSADVEGALTADQALRILLAGTGLTARYASGDAFTLEPANVMKGSTAAATPNENGSVAVDHGAYFAELQDALIQGLCHRAETQPGRYRLGLQLWIAPGGIIRASHLLGSTGDAQRDTAIADQLRAIPVAVPPPQLPQPVTVVLLPQSPGQAAECRDGVPPE